MSMVSPVDSSLNGVVWKRTLKEPVISYPALQGEETADLVVVGAGYCGLNTALHAALNGLKVILLEAGIVGNGASGRNGGYNVPHFPGAVTPSAVEAAIGKRKGQALAELVSSGAEKAFRQIDDHAIACSAEQNGWVQPAHSETSLQKVKKVHDEWKALGVNVQWLDKGAVGDLLGARGYIGGWLNPTGGTVNPYGLAIGLGRAASNAGVRILENSPVDTITEGAGGVTVKCGAGRVRARTVIVATNAYTGNSFPGIQKSVIPVFLYHASTRPLSAETQASMIRTRLCFTDLRKSGGFGRLDPEGRFVAGGAVFAFGNRKAYGLKHARERMQLLFPQVSEKEAEIEDYWEGYCAITDTYLPHMVRVSPNVFGVVGFSTRGVNLAQNLGRVVGEFAAGKRSLDDIPVALVEQRQDIPNWSFKVRAARLVFPFYKMKDRLGLT
ncbi:hypothetical protein ACO34A_19445 [Rhizobium sp. ACO-34A]|nr:FAD-dependent oxidoreductase [Rhizobium sp. ACO-34A]ATN35984.1 hypothetical protein ACO34A_19445 [Rhizobium sp. ACO-34A]